MRAAIAKAKPGFYRGRKTGRTLYFRVRWKRRDAARRWYGGVGGSVRSGTGVACSVWSRASRSPLETPGFRRKPE